MTSQLRLLISLLSRNVDYSVGCSDEEELQQKLIINNKGAKDKTTDYPGGIECVKTNLKTVWLEF